MREETEIDSCWKLKFSFLNHKLASNIIDCKKFIEIFLFVIYIISLFFVGNPRYFIMAILTYKILLVKITQFWVQDFGSMLQVVNTKAITYLNMKPVQVNRNYTKNEISELRNLTLKSFEELCNSDIFEKLSNDYFDFTTSKTILKRLIKEVSRINGLSFDKEIFEIKSKEGGTLLISGEKVFLENKGKKINTMECNNLSWFAPIALIRKRILENKDYIISVRLPVSLLKSKSSS